MHYMVIVGSGIVATFFGPFANKADAEQWAKDTDNRHYVIVLVYPPYAGK